MPRCAGSPHTHHVPHDHFGKCTVVRKIAGESSFARGPNAVATLVLTPGDESAFRV